jgi:hypothetical protein
MGDGDRLSAMAIGYRRRATLIGYRLSAIGLRAIGGGGTGHAPSPMNLSSWSLFARH